MTKTGIIVADGARARFITFELPDDQDLDGGARCTEHAKLDNPDGHAPPRELFSDRPSRKPSGLTGSGHRSDDHRERHELENERRFVDRLIEEAERFVQQQGVGRLILAAEPQLLGMLRSQMNSAAKQWSRLELIELRQDLSGLSLQNIRERLTREGHLPVTAPPRGSVFRPRGQPVPS